MFEMKITIDITPTLGNTLNRVADALIGACAPVITVDGQSIGQSIIQSVGQAESAPVAQAPAAPVPAVPVAQPAPAPAPAVPVAQAPAPVPAVPVAQSAPTYTKEQIASAGAMYMQQDPANRDKLQTLLAQFGAPYINALPDEQLGAFATALRGLGANI